MKKQTKPLSIRIPLELKEKLQKIADKEYRPLATQIVKILSDYVKITSKKERYDKWRIKTILQGKKFNL